MSDDPSVDLIRALVEHMRGGEGRWDALAMVLEFDDTRFRGTYGYVYATDGTPAAVAARPSAVVPFVEAYLAQHLAPGAPPPRKLLVQLDRTSGTYEFTFEDTDAERWRVSPATLDTVHDELRPNFG